MPTDISIIVPSRNGADTLAFCLEALSNATPPDADFEVLLIDNASDDDTPEILAAHAKKENWQFLSEPRRGKSFALNTALEAASGELIVFMDDDILPDRDWLKAYHTASRASEHVDVFAGQLRPKWSGEVPAWLQSMTDEGRCCGCTALSWTAGPYPAMQVKGGNVMVRRSAIGDIRFDTVSTNYDAGAKAVGGEDTLFVKQLVEKGSKIEFVPDARGEHILQAHETRLSALLQRQRRIGRSIASAGNHSGKKKLLSFPAIVAYALAAGGLTLIGKREQAMKEVFKIAMRLGHIEQWYFTRS